MKMQILEQKLNEIYTLVNNNTINNINNETNKNQINEIDIINWFKNNYIFTNNKEDKIKLKDAYDIFKISSIFTQLTKTQKLPIKNNPKDYF